MAIKAIHCCFHAILLAFIILNCLVQTVWENNLFSAVAMAALAFNETLHSPCHLPLLPPK